MIGFLLGCAFGGVVVFVLMCCVQISKNNEYDTQIAIAFNEAKVCHEDAMYYKEKYKAAIESYDELYEKYIELYAEGNNGKEN